MAQCGEHRSPDKQSQAARDRESGAKHHLSVAAGRRNDDRGDEQETDDDVEHAGPDWDFAVGFAHGLILARPT